MSLLHSVSLGTHPYIADHCLKNDIVVIPGTFYLMMFLSEARRMMGSPSLSLTDIYYSDPVTFLGDEEYRLELSVDQDAHSSAHLMTIRACLSDRSGDSSAWRTVASALLTPFEHQQNSGLKEEDYTKGTHLSAKEFYAGLASDGLTFGSKHQNVTDIWVTPTEAIGQVMYPDDIRMDEGSLHPAVLDACMQVGVLLLPKLSSSEIYVTLGIRSVHWHCDTLPSTLFSRAVLSDNNNDGTTCVDFVISDESGQVLGYIFGYQFHAINATTLDHQHIPLVVSEWVMADVSSPTRDSTLPVMIWSFDPSIVDIGQYFSWGDSQSFSPIFGNKEQPIPTEVEEVAAMLKKQFDALPILPNAESQCDVVIDLGQSALNGASFNTVMSASAVDAQQVLPRFFTFIQHLYGSYSQQFRSCIIVSRSEGSDRGSIDDNGFLSIIDGLCVTLLHEYPSVRTARLDSPVKVDLSHVCDFVYQQKESAIRLHHDMYQVKRLRYGMFESMTKEANSSKTANEESVSISSDAAYLISGGLGEIGLNVAEWLLAQGAGCVYLLGRRQPSDLICRRIDKWNAMRVCVHVIVCDVSSVEAVERLTHFEFDRPLKGIIHAAGLTDDGFITDRCFDDLDRLVAPKLFGGLVLHRVSASYDLDFFICFSSVVSLLGATGASLYAAANRSMDQLIRWRQAQGLCGLSIQWGPWALGMFEKVKTYWLGAGFRPISPAEGLTVLGWLIRQRLSGCVAYFPIDWSVYLKRHSLGSYLNILLQTSDDDSNVGNSVSDILHRLEAAAAEERYDILRDHMMLETEKILGILPDKSTIDYPFRDVGFDSISLVSFIDQLAEDLDMTLPPTLPFTYSTLDMLCRYLVDTRFVSAADSTEVESQVTVHDERQKIGDAISDDVSQKDIAELLEDELKEIDILLK